MKKLLSVCLIFASIVLLGQEITAKSIFHQLAKGDSVIVYQCHVEKAITTLQTESGQTLQGKQQWSSITEKFCISVTEKGWTLKYYTSDLNVLPNRKFSGLKIREKEYWHFSFVQQKTIRPEELKALLILEERGSEAIEYDFVISKYTTNQIIFKKRKNFKQLVYDDSLLLSHLLQLR